MLEAATVEFDSHAILWCSSINRFSISPPINVCRLNLSLPTFLGLQISFPKILSVPLLLKIISCLYESAFRKPQNTFVVSACFPDPSYSPIKKVFCLKLAHLYSAILKGDIQLKLSNSFISLNAECRISNLTQGGRQILLCGFCP